VLRSVGRSHGHVVVKFTVGDLSPGVIQVATRSAKARAGGFVPGNVRIEETITAKPDQATGVVSWRTSVRLAAGTYYVEDSAIPPNLITNHPPVPGKLPVHWTHVIRFAVR
jgi:hypothetical protein